MGEKTAGVGHFTIPTSPAIGTACAQSASANTYGSYVQITASTPAAIFITGIYVELAAAANIPTYMAAQIGTGVAASEATVGIHHVPIGPTSGVAATTWAFYKPIFPPIAVANATRVAVKTASSVASALAWAITLECINQANVVDDGVTVGTVTTVTGQLTAAQIATGVWQDTTAGDFTTASSIGKSLYTTGAVPGAAGGIFIAGTNAATTITTGLTTTFTGNLTGSVASVTGAVGSVTGLTASNLDAAVSSRMASYTQPTGFLAATFPAGTVANTTNITAGTITTATNLTNAATAGDLTATMKTSVTTAATAATPTAAAVTGAVGSVAAAVTLPTIPANWISAAGIAAAALNGKGDWNMGKTGYSLTQTFPTNFSTLAISAAGLADANIKAVNGTTVNGNGSVGTPWGP